MYYFLKLVVKYCKLKAANILKCLKQGIDPPRGNPNNPDPPPGPEGEIDISELPPEADNPPPSGMPSGIAPQPPPQFTNPPPLQFINPPPSNPQPPQYMQPPPYNPPPANTNPTNLQPPQAPSFPQSQFIGSTPQSSYTAPGYSASTIVSKRKVDPKNPYNTEGKIVRQHPMYFDIIDKAQKLLEHAMADLNSKSLANAVKSLESAYKSLDLLEN